MIKKIDHIAIAVKNLAEEIEKYRDLLGLEFCGTEEVEEQKVKVAFFKVGDTFIELLEPTSPDSPISAFLEKRGGGIHHIAFETDDINKEIALFETKGLTLLNREPKKGAHNALISFLHPKNFCSTLIEIKQKGE